jgi:hypothetical protein
MIGLNISGRVGQDAKVLDNGNCIFSIASTRKGYTKQDGTKVDDYTTWISCFKSKGEKIAAFIKKGMYITAFADNIKADVYDGKGQLSCNVISIEFGSKTDNQQNEQSDLDRHMSESYEPSDLAF